ncbi:MAG: porin family protein [Gammaproteobacteria bacterium]|nr:porin family protein [Gammaproteobacteria bacterium]MCW9006229.1 porin family protein [Gammaproteobacteria bacterium]MCW9057148.1 porin family protein [Gammaproteobacteria bacterium]
MQSTAYIPVGVFSLLHGEVSQKRFTRPLRSPPKADIPGYNTYMSFFFNSNQFHIDMAQKTFCSLEYNKSVKNKIRGLEMNKLSIFIIALTSIVNVAEARDISQGTFMFSGDTGFVNSSSKITGNGASVELDISVINVKGGYFFAKNLGIGLMISNEEIDANDGTNSSINLIGPFIEYSVNLNEDFNLIFNAGILDVSGDEDDGLGQSYKYDGDGTLLMASIAYFISDTVTINVGIRKTDSDINVTDNVSNIHYSGDMSETATTIGFSVFF